MEYAKLGNSGLDVSRICLGCMGFGDSSLGHHTWTLDEDKSREIIQHALDQGINFFDTAMAYGDGTSEKFVGRALRDFAKRDDVVLATKFSQRTAEEIATNVSGQTHVSNCLDASLARLGMDYIDLYICHMWDHNTPIEEIMDGLNTAVTSGKVRAIGISNCYAWQLSKANAIAEKNGWAQFVSIQGHYNLIFREEEREMAGYCKDANIAMTPYSALAAGRLSRRPNDESTKRLDEDKIAMGKYGVALEADSVIIGRVIELAEKRNVTMTEISLAWLLTKSTSPIVGATKLSHIDGAVNAVKLTLTEEEIAYLEEPYIPHKLVGVMGFNTGK